MSKAVSILEGQKGRKFSGVKYLRTDLQGGGTCEWVPEDERKLTTKRITKNGTYLASDEKDSNKKPYYGFSQVTVAIRNGTTGKKNPSTGGDGNEYSVTVDEDGSLKETPLPSSIVITTSPNKTEYVDGETILMSGAVVKAYKADGTLWEATGYAGGVIPLEELTIEPDKADISKSKPTGASSELLTPDLNPLLFSGEVKWYSRRLSTQYTVYATGTGVVRATAIVDTAPDITMNYIAVSESEMPIVVIRSQHNDDEPIIATNESEAEISYLGKNFYLARILSRWTRGGDRDTFEGTWNETTVGVDVWSDPYHTKKLNSYQDIGYAMLYDTIPDGGQTITVKWTRPEDMKELTTSFTIDVTR